ncbi:hypothetical protein ACLBXM_02300 [Xanthobacteraceae bacterium A53D]
MRRKDGTTAGLGMVLGLGMAMIGVLPAHATETKAECKANGDYLIIYRDSTLGPGQDILARKGAPLPSTCAWDKAPGDVVVSTHNEADYVLGLAGRFVVMDRGTGPNRTLVIWDLAARKQVLSAGYDDEAPVKVEERGVTFAEITGAATAKTCKSFNAFKKDGFDAVLVETTRLSLPSLARNRTGTPRCIAQQ